MSDPLAVLASLAYGFGSAFVPILNAEAYVAVYAVAGPLLLVLVVLGVSIGQTVGKYVMFEATRRGQHLMRKRESKREPRNGPIATRVRQWNAQMIRLLDSPRGGAATVLVSASVGLPPLAVVSIVAGASSQRRATFAVCCLVGRLARFAVLAAPIAYVAA